MMQGITDLPTQQDDRMATAVALVQEQAADLTVFNLQRADVARLVLAGLKVLDSPPQTEDQRDIALEYQYSLPAKERNCLRLHQIGWTSEAIARELKANVEWVRRTNARHKAELRLRLYQPES